ncbi:hypothetical protein KCU98_g12512, partial [Aureobasidium melanogenum]
MSQFEAAGANMNWDWQQFTPSSTPTTTVFDINLNNSNAATPTQTHLHHAFPTYDYAHHKRDSVASTATAASIDSNPHYVAYPRLHQQQQPYHSYDYATSPLFVQGQSQSQSQSQVPSQSQSQSQPQTFQMQTPPPTRGSSTKRRPQRLDSTTPLTSTALRQPNFDNATFDFTASQASMNSWTQLSGPSSAPLSAPAWTANQDDPFSHWSTQSSQSSQPSHASHSFRSQASSQSSAPSRPTITRSTSSNNVPYTTPTAAKNPSMAFNVDPMQPRSSPVQTKFSNVPEARPVSPAKPCLAPAFPSASGQGSPVKGAGLQRSNTVGNFLKPSPEIVSQASGAASSLGRSNSICNLPRRSSPLKRIARGSLSSIAETARPQVRTSVVLTIDANGTARTETRVIEESPSQSKKESQAIKDKYPNLWDDSDSDSDSTCGNRWPSRHDSLAHANAGQERSAKMARLDTSSENLEMARLPRSNSTASLKTPCKAAYAAAMQLRRQGSAKKQQRPSSVQSRRNTLSSLNSSFENLAAMDLNKDEMHVKTDAGSALRQAAAHRVSPPNQLVRAVPSDPTPSSATRPRQLSQPQQPRQLQQIQQPHQIQQMQPPQAPQQIQQPQPQRPQHMQQVQQIQQLPPSNQTRVVVEDMAHQVADQQSATSQASICSSLSYLSVAQTRSPEEQGKWKPRRRHVPPPALPTHRRARGYDDLFPFEVSQLASVLCHAPPINTPRDGAVWTAYVSHTNQRIALLGPKLRASTSLPNFLPWSANHGSCYLHRHLNTKPLEDILAALRYEAEVRTQEVWQHVALAGALSASQTEQLALMDELQSLWLPPSKFMEKFDRLPAPRFAYQADGCVACILARMGGNLETAMALGALLLGSMRRSDMLSTRVCFCREWVRYTVEGDIDCVDTALADMETMGTKFRKARKWARQRAKAMAYLAGRDPLLLDSKSFPSQIRYQEPLNGNKTAPVHQPSLDLYRCEQHHPTYNSAKPQLLDPGCSAARDRPSVRGMPLQPRLQEPIPQESWKDRNMVLEPSSSSQISQSKVTASAVNSAAGKNSMDTPPSKTINTNLMSSPTSLYSELTSNPFLDGNSSPSPLDNRHLPPDLPFRLFERRCARDNDGSPSPPKNAVQWPKQTPLVKRLTADQFKDNLVPVPILARLDKSDRSIGALWKRRAKRSMADQGVIR